MESYNRRRCIRAAARTSERPHGRSSTDYGNRSGKMTTIKPPDYPDAARSPRHCQLDYCGSNPTKLVLACVGNRYVGNPAALVMTMSMFGGLLLR